MAKASKTQALREAEIKTVTHKKRQKSFTIRKKIGLITVKNPKLNLKKKLAQTQHMKMYDDTIDLDVNETENNDLTESHLAFAGN